MSLQYRTRSMSSDRDWRQRVRLSLLLLMETVDGWCRQDGEFPVEQSVAGVIYIFSPRWDPFSAPEVDVQQRVFALADTPQNEYRKTWPLRTESCGMELIDALCEVLDDAVTQWSNGSMLTPTIESVNQQLAEVIVALQFVVFHHHQTTTRDFGGFHGTG